MVVAFTALFSQYYKVRAEATGIIADTIPLFRPDVLDRLIRTGAQATSFTSCRRDTISGSIGS